MLVDHQPTSGAGFVEFPRASLEASVIEHFERQVEDTPGRLALKDGHVSVTYFELNVLANRIAHAVLERRGTEPAPVAVLLDDSINVIAALIGTLKAGDFYLLLDPADPTGRVRTLLDDAQPGLIVCHSPTRTIAHDLGSSVRVLDLDAPGFAARHSTDNPRQHIAPDALVNVMYTSGSTGRPKGVLQTHRTLLQGVMSSHNRLRYTVDDRMALLSPLGVGVSAAMLFGGLLIGAAVFPFSVRRHGVAKVLDWLREERITNTYSLPSVIRTALQLLPAGEKLPDLRLIKVGGEPVFRSDLPLLRDHLLPGSILQVVLGTTETYGISWSHVDPWSEPDTPVLPVGRPELDREVVLVDDAGQPVAAGEVGEIIVRSHYLSPGYWRQPEATAAAFKTRGDGRREYRTGDLGRILSDGSLLHLGRRDSVAKIHGHLVAPGEVETALRELDGVAQVAVVPRADGGRTRLVAYVVVDPGARTDSRELRARLGQNLPEYMVPAEYVFLDHMPFLPNGKIDLAHLPGPAAPTEQRAAHTPVESLLVQIWSEVLGREVGTDQEFLELGGDSLTAAHVLARINNACGVELPFSALFDAPTITLLAQVVAEHLGQSLDQASLSDLLDELETMSEADAERYAQGLN
jgi:amino acid adenylation domain-containing protein